MVFVSRVLRFFEQRVNHFKFWNDVDPVNIGTCGDNVIIKHKKSFFLGKGSTFNDNCYFNAKGGICIGDNTLLGNNILIMSANHLLRPFADVQNANNKASWVRKEGKKRLFCESVIIGDDVWVGAGCIILAGAKIPDKVVLGAGCIVTKSNSLRLKEGDVVVPDVKLRVLKSRCDL